MNLLSKLHKNSILTGPIESYCLACGTLLRSEEESYAHIHLPHHVDKLQALPQLDGYKDDCIIKIKEGYFCPHCNIILPTIKRISLHVVEKKHKESKIAQSITRHADSIFLFDIAAIDPRAWHGVDGTTCSVCNEDYADEKEHTAEPAHALKLIQAKCEFGENYVYRNVDEDLFFCLICKSILPIIDKESHSNSKSHKELYEKSSTDGAAIKKKNSSELNNNIAEEKSDNTLPEVKSDPNGIDNNNPKKQVSEVDNGSTCGVDDSRRAVKIDSQEYNPRQVNYNTQNPQTPVPQTEPNFTQTKSTPYMYKLLKSLDFVIKTVDDKAFCTLCDLSVDVADIEIHSANKHHRILYQKHITKKNSRKNKLSEKSEALANIKKQTNIEVATSKSEKVPVTEKSKAQEAASKVDKPVEASTNNVGEEANTKNKLSEKSEADTANIKKQTNIEVATGKSEKVPVTENSKAQEAASKVDKPVEASTNNVGKEANTKNKLSEKSEADTANIQKQTNIEVATGKSDKVPVTEKSKAQEAASKVDKPVEASTNNVGEEANTKNKLSEKSEADTANIKKQTNIEVATSKTDKVPVTEKSKAQEAASKVDKPVEASTNNVAKDVVDESTEINQVVRKEILAPENKVEDERITAPQPTPKPNNVPASQKSTKKAQKKAAKAQAVLLTQQSDVKTSTQMELEANNTKNNNEFVTGNENVTEKTANNDPETVNGITNIPIRSFIKTISQVDSSPGDVVINSEYVVGNLSFALLVRTGGNYECVACNEILTVDDIHKHISTEEHLIKFEDCPVVTSLDDEFIRQVQEKQHCGFCNLTLANWEKTKEHLGTYQHSDAKTSASWRLDRYLPHLNQREKKEVRSVIAAVFRQTIE